MSGFNIDEEQVSQIDDEEMARMNIEISAALAWWLALVGPMGWSHAESSRPVELSLRQNGQSRP
jgi:hypothetical protein